MPTSRIALSFCLLALPLALELGLGRPGAAPPAALAAAPGCEREAPGRRELRVLPAQAWRYERAWTLSSDEVLFGTVGNVAALDSGRVAVTDLQLGNVLIVGAGGELRRVLAARGEGPGRVTQLSQAVHVPGEGLGLVQGWPARVEVVRLDGTPVRTLRRDPAGPDAYAGILDLQGAGGELVAALCEVDAEGAQTASLLSLCSLGPELEPVRTFNAARIVNADREGLVDETAGWFPRTAWAPLGGGRLLFCPCRERFRLCRLDLASGRAETWERDLAPVPRSERDFEVIKRGYRWTVNGVERTLDFRLYENREMIERLVPLPGQRVLAVSARVDRGLHGRGTARLDLVDLEAGTATDVYVDVPYRHLRDRLFVLPSRDLVIATEAYAAQRGGPLTEGEPPTVQCWRFREVVE